MIKGENKANRVRLCKLAYKDPQRAAEELHRMADALGECRNTNDSIYALTEIFCVSKSTIYRDLK